MTPQRQPFHPTASATVQLNEGAEWDQYPDEPSLSYERFVWFKNRGPGRQLADVVEHYKLTMSSIRQLSQRFRWHDRAQAWDRFQDVLYALQMTQERKRVAVKQIGLADTILDLINDRLAKLKAGAITIRDLGPLMKIAADMQRSALGLDQPQDPKHPNITITQHIDARQQSITADQETMRRIETFNHLAGAASAAQGARDNIIDAEPS